MVIVNGSEIPFKAGMTAADAIQAAGELTDGVTLIVIDGKVIPPMELNTTLMSDSTVIKLMRIISGG